MVRPIPLAGQTIQIEYLPNVYKWTQRMDKTKRNADGRHMWGSVTEKTLVERPQDGTLETIVCSTPIHVPFAMPSFQGTVEKIEIPRSNFDTNTLPESVFILRNFDGQHGRTLATSLEDCYGKDILLSKGSSAKCGAAQGNNSQDTYSKLYPPRMQLADGERARVLKPLLDSCIEVVNAHANSSGWNVLDPSRIMLANPAFQNQVGEAQILKWKSQRGKSAGGKMHMHCDRLGTGWVAIMNLGETSRFLLDHSYNCTRCFKDGKDKGGQGRKNASKKWFEIECESCIDVQLHSGDCILFYGCDRAHVAHGSLGTMKDKDSKVLGGLPNWCGPGQRISIQYRQTYHRTW